MIYLGMKISTAIRYFFLAIYNAAAFYVIPLAISFESWFLLLIIGLITLLINFTYFSYRFQALKWITPGFIFLIAFVLFPAGYSFYVSFTNWSTGHILTKQQAIERLEDLSYSTDDQKGVEFDLYVLQDQDLNFYYVADLDDENLLFGRAINDDQYDDKFFATHEPSLKNSNGEIIIPDTYYQLSGKEQIANSSQLQELALLIDKNTRIKLYNISVFGASSGRLSSSQQKYSYDDVTDTLYDNSQNVECTLGLRGNFVCDGESVDPGWRINVGTENYQRIVNDQRLRGPLSIVTSWTFQFALLSVSLAFFVGLLLAVTLNNDKVKFQKIYRSIYILPYAIPAFISIIVFKGLLNPDYGVINEWFAPLYELFNIEPINWFRTKGSSRAAVLLVNTWLGFPYMFLIVTGALQSIPKELLEAAKVDGATPRQSFWRITFPLLLVSISPLLIGAFAFNFNNFTLIFLLTSGGPPIVGADVAVGYTDILISFTYDLAIAGGRGYQFGLAASVTTIIFFIVLIISAISFRYSKRLERVYGNL